MKHSDTIWREIQEHCEANGIDDAFQEAVGHCAMGTDGQCGHAGSEYCEFECPFRAEQIEQSNQGAQELFQPHIVLHRQDNTPVDTIALCLDWRDPVALASILFYAEQTTDGTYGCYLLDQVQGYLNDPCDSQRIQWTDSYPSEQDLRDIIEDAYVSWGHIAEAIEQEPKDGEA